MGNCRCTVLFAGIIGLQPILGLRGLKGKTIFLTGNIRCSVPKKNWFQLANNIRNDPVSG